MVTKQEEGCARLINGQCELGYQACALTMHHPNCKDRKTIQLTKQEEIREGIKQVILSELKSGSASIEEKVFLSSVLTDSIRGYLKSKGVVIKVDRELSDNVCENDDLKKNARLSSASHVTKGRPFTIKL
ncbi:hypothetical protein LCGC14_2106090 [marine sediment metagenome]|uniref:Uncharacterized protein n=1 Tax=marine sediment metagenome TaxID=412755 RepID=A0A0F9E8H6_9ZZZZ